MGVWRIGDEQLRQLSRTDALRRGYERAVTDVIAALGGVPSLELLMAHYANRWDHVDGIATVVEQARTRYAPKKETLLRHVIEDAGYYRRAKQLLSIWWTQDWEPTSAASEPGDDAPRDEATRTQRASSKRAGVLKTKQHQPGERVPAASTLSEKGTKPTEQPTSPRRRRHAAREAGADV